MKCIAAFVGLLVATARVAASAYTCKAYKAYTEGPYTVYNNLYAKDAATSGSQCLGVDSLSGSTIAWHTSWTWVGG